MMSAEPYCNHDQGAVRDGVCECGEIMISMEDARVEAARLYARKVVDAVAAINLADGSDFYVRRFTVRASR